MSEWINIKEKLPPIDRDILFLVNFKGCRRVYEGYFYISYVLYSLPLNLCEFITHWMEYPELPKD